MKSLFIFINSHVYLFVCLSTVHGNKCPGPNEYYSCGGACDNVCETLHIMNQTHCPIVNIKCNDMCYCKEGFARDANNICVPFKECLPSCGLDEEYKTCTCPPDMCVSLQVTKFKCGPCVSVVLGPCV